MKHVTINFVLLLLFFISTINQVQCICVLESDFGFALNCNFKNAGMFRIRNLGGLKAHIGLGFSLGDELGFPESLGNVEGSKKRSLDVRTMGKGNSIGYMPEKMPQIGVQYNQPMRQIATVAPDRMTPYRGFSRPLMAVPQIPQAFKKPQLMTEALTLPLGVPRFKKLPQDPKKASENIMYITPTQQPTTSNIIRSVANAYPSKSFEQTASSNVNVVSVIPSFQALPLSTSNKFESLTKVETSPPEEDLPNVDLKGHTIEELAAVANVSVETIKSAIKLRQQQMLVEKKIQQSAADKKKILEPLTMQTTLQSTTVEKTTQRSTTQSSKTTTNFIRSTSAYIPKKKVKKHPLQGSHKVMNAPKEYYPSGYDKNYDDNFKSKVDLPATSFHCGDQKHFPGLYGDEELGCMVFHVCALTDDGLIMKSFLCPESTLFDQTILKCNWWFYTDCKSSQTLYDSNLPVSKSYQLMKSLSFFSKNYKTPSNETVEIVNDSLKTDDNVLIVTPLDQQ
ncbi:hypothetical protein ACKWTF_008036 [Chironomus riparius]